MSNEVTKLTLDALRDGYWFALQMPHNAVRIHNQHVLCQLRDAIAELEDRSAEDVQNEYEQRAAA